MSYKKINFIKIQTLTQGYSNTFLQIKSRCIIALFVIREHLKFLKHRIIQKFMNNIN